MDLERLLAQPNERRCWLLLKALECVPLNEAVDLARTADQFVMGNDHSMVATSVENMQGVHLASLPAPNAAAERNLCLAKSSQVGLAPQRHAKPPVQTVNGSNVSPTISSPPSQGTKPSPEPEEPVEFDRSVDESSRVNLSANQRAELLKRAANGATNAELAAEYGLKPRQVQGLRMVAARTKQSINEPVTPLPSITATADEVVRYLRQRDDVVVPEGAGTFLVNGRFRLDLPELVAKANRARDRENKPLFKINGLTDAASPSQSNGHPLFSHPSSASIEF